MYTRLHSYISGILVYAENAAAIIAGFAAVLAMFLVSADAIMRYVFAAPLTFQLYFTENYLLVMMFIMALPWGYRTGGYIRIDGFIHKLALPLRNFILRAGLLASAAYVAYLAKQAFGKFLEVYQDNDLDMGVIDWPVWISWVWIPIGCGMLALRLLLDATAPEAPNLENEEQLDLDQLS